MSTQQNKSTLPEIRLRHPTYHRTLEIPLSDTVNTKTIPPYIDAGTAEFVYFDVAPTFGVMNGAIQIELASRILIPGPEAPESRFLMTGRLRCSPAAAGNLRDAINSALEQLEQLQQGQVATGSKLN